MDALDKKRLILLNRVERLEKRIKEYKSLDRYKRGLNTIRRVLIRMYKFPDIYMRHLKFKFFTRNRRVKILGEREIILPSYRDSSISDLFLGFLIDDYEIKTTKYLIKALNPEDVFYDIGVNYGFYTYLALEFCREIHSFEPVPHICENLNLNLRNENKVKLNCVAVSDINGQLKMSIGKHSTAISSIAPNNIKFSFKNEITVRSLTLDSYVYEYGNSPPTIIKLDVEGAENLVLRGAQRVLNESSPIIIMEVWGESQFLDNSSHKEAFIMLTYQGYKCFRIKSDGDLERVDEPSYVNIDNYVFMKY